MIYKSCTPLNISDTESGVKERRYKTLRCYAIAFNDRSLIRVISEGTRKASVYKNCLTDFVLIAAFNMSSEKDFRYVIPAITRH